MNRKDSDKAGCNKDRAIMKQRAWMLTEFVYEEGDLIKIYWSIKKKCKTAFFRYAYNVELIQQASAPSIPAISEEFHSELDLLYTPWHDIHKERSRPTPPSKGKISPTKRCKTDPPQSSSCDTSIVEGTKGLISDSEPPQSSSCDTSIVEDTKGLISDSEPPQSSSCDTSIVEDNKGLISDSEEDSSSSDDSDCDETFLQVPTPNPKYDPAPGDSDVTKYCKKICKKIAAAVACRFKNGISKYALEYLFHYIIVRSEIENGAPQCLPFYCHLIDSKFDVATGDGHSICQYRIKCVHNCRKMILAEESLTKKRRLRRSSKDSSSSLCTDEQNSMASNSDETCITTDLVVYHSIRPVIVIESKSDYSRLQDVKKHIIENTIAACGYASPSWDQYETVKVMGAIFFNNHVYIYDVIRSCATFQIHEYPKYPLFEFDKFLEAVNHLKSAISRYQPR